MVSKLDQSVATVIDALQNNSMLNNSIVVFVSDNGAPSTGLMRNYGSNWPLKGVSKSNTLYLRVATQFFNADFHSCEKPTCSRSFNLH